MDLNAVENVLETKVAKYRKRLNSNRFFFHTCTPLIDEVHA